MSLLSNLNLNRIIEINEGSQVWKEYLYVYEIDEDEQI